MNATSTFSARLRLILYIRRMKPVDLSNKTGISKSIISRYMSGEFEPKNDRLGLMAKALNVSPTWLSGFDVPMFEETEHHEELRDQIKEKLLNCTDEQLEKILDYTNLLTK